MADNVTIPLTGESAACAAATFLDPQAAAALKLPTSARGYAGAASAFLIAFEQLRDEVPMLPRLYLAAQTLEYTLKAYIGWADASKLGKPLLGHDLLNLWEMAFDASNAAPIKLLIGRKPPEWCETLATFHGSPYMDRYPPDVAMAYSLANHEDLTGKLRALLAEVEAAFPQ